MKKTVFLLLVSVAFVSWKSTDTAELDKVIDTWHEAAANANFETYFALTTDDFVFLGTDPKERWSRSEFQTFCKPYFDAGKAWKFIPSNRHWMFSHDGKTAWFDEQLDTWMKDCRGSGVMVKTPKGWKLAYYNLTVLIENEKIKSFIELRERPQND